MKHYFTFKIQTATSTEVIVKIGAYEFRTVIEDKDWLNFVNSVLKPNPFEEKV